VLAAPFVGGRVHNDRMDAVGRHHPSNGPQWSIGWAGDHPWVHCVDDPEVLERSDSMRRLK
jgi:hypothetical protein